MKNKCKWCSVKYNLQDKPKGWMANHARWCNHNPKRNDYVCQTKKARDLSQKSKNKSGFTNQFSKAKILGLEHPNVNVSFYWKGRKHSEETKKKLSDIRKRYLVENSESHVWKRHDKFKSAPCEKLKEFLVSRCILFESEYSKHNVTGRFFSIDIAIPEKMIALEVNGNQHYESNGNLKLYYKKREELLKIAGWNVVQIHYSLCYNHDSLVKLIDTIL